MATAGSSMISENAAAHKLVTEENVKAALENDQGPDVVFKSFEVIDFTGKGDNYACFVTSVKVFFSQAGETKYVTYVAKLNPCRNISTIEPWVKSIFSKEAKFYTEFVDDINSVLKKQNKPQLRVPRCLYVSLEPLKEIIFLEDMRAKQFKMFDRMQGMDDAHTKLVVEELARLHSASMILRENLGEEALLVKHSYLKEDVFMNSTDLECQKMLEGMFQGLLLSGAKIANKIKDYGEVAKFLKDMIPSCMDEFKVQMECDTKFRTVCHGDCWNNNLLFRNDRDGKPVEVCLVDLQVNRYASLALDMNHLFFTSLTGQVRRGGTKSFLSTYYSAFRNVYCTEEKEMPFSEDELQNEYRNKNMFGLLMSMVVVPAVVMASTNVPDFNDWNDGNMKKRFANHQQAVIEMINTSPLLQPRFLDILDEMIEHGIIKLKK